MTEYEKKCLTCKNNYKPSDCEPRCNCMCENHNMYEPISRYDRIVKMSVEEMAQLFCENFDCASCPAYDLCRETEEPEWNGFIKFLNVEVDNETNL